MKLHGLDLALTGWFQVAWSVDIGPEQVVPLRYFGRDLVAYRGRDGVVRVHDRYCRHLGASLAHGGCVVDEGIRCPFHGWVWSPEGRNVSIPYQDRPNRGPKLGTWTTVERNETIYVWHDAAGREPLWDVPDALGDAPHAASRRFHPAGVEGRQHFRDLRAHPQMVLENVVDPHHFRFVHHTAASPVVLEERVEGAQWWSRVGFGRGWAQHARDAEGRVRTDTANTIEILWSGPGVSVNVEHMGEGVRVISINTTPVEDGRTEIFATYWIDELAGDLADGTYERRLADAKLALPDDIVIWANQTFLDAPALATEEARGFRALRSWSAQFYPDAAVSPEARRTAAVPEGAARAAAGT
ncbi:ring-hydroxylating dioxygenase, large terminal subunit [Frankia torreyi]|uniref:cholesterol 7-desaturase n=1 Tax=Frankia torreyi TaxID=1856 RepID=A0A0D8BEW4_9ACTN|nr:MULTISPECIES: Rieske 2Fe-2S domain-containing protein [Frankia]KJE22529.1 ring-hydroxylating dioxygenase, large terminal subunit [Frankia torreyi]KQC38289.1 Rieske (2Fe-2S) protein [Frankia sp. ACN1ag]KQM04568.1 ring-hydroxylating dioxygenase, large terminal subunit [Frankia sp. CpI1-P]